MKFRKLLAPVCVAALGFGTAVGTFALADAARPEAKKDAPAASTPQLPPGWTEADMQACIVAGTPGEKHKALAWHVGNWEGKNTMWMMPDAPPMTSETKMAVTSIMEGRYLQIQLDGDMPGMGPYKGMGLLGYDNVTGKYVANWIDNHSTTIMFGIGTESKDGKTRTIEYTYTCPINKKPTVMREVETITGPNTKVFEMHGAEPKSGKEYKMMRIEWTKK